ncbi:MAG TPA: NADH-quinone oxidoreductase subunit C [Candidatus Lokiarchaeia archaeon]|nr:NADH-quinone oxidoreductase subunit C [Candidatus Lokiarchaeia archaeon]
MASVEEKIQVHLNDQLGGDAPQVQPIAKGKVFIQVEPSLLKGIVKGLIEKDELTGLIAITGVDLGDTIEVMHHLRTMETIFTIRTLVSKENPELETIIDLLPGANLHEKEVTDLMGVKFTGNLFDGHFLLSEAWPKDNFPLRKDAEIPSIDDLIKNPVVIDEPESIPGEEKYLNITIGPQHPALLEPERFQLHVEGEIVIGVTPRLGYVHRAVEKACESRTYMQDVYLVERICGICNACHVTTFCQSVENILGTEVPARGRYLRTIAAELNRIHSHMLLFGHAGLEIGFQTLFQYTWRDREAVMDLIEILTGNRVNMAYITLGGVRRDVTDTLKDRIRTDLAKLEQRMPFYKNLYENELSLRARLKGVGIISREDALKLCVVGPVARASGVKIDVRKDDPYAAYDEIPFNIVTYNDCDSLARLKIRVDEIYESIHIIDYALEHLPDGPIRVRVPRSVPAGEAVSRVEAPRGELFYYVKANGTQSPERVKVRTPTFANILSFVHMAKGINVADVPPAFVSLDPCFSCTDR